jgi:hypothetical protein
MKWSWCFIFLMVWSCGRASDTTVTVVEGEDYALPGWVKAEEFSGYTGSPPGPGLNNRWHVSWKDLEPERGKYNWDIVEEEFAKARAGGYRVMFYLKSIEVSGGWPEREPRRVLDVVPDWVLEDMGAPTDTIGWNFNIEILAGWQPEVRDAFNTMIREFGKAGFPKRDELLCSYIHGVSHSYGEEFWMLEEKAAQLERTMGFSPQVLRDWITSRIDAYAEAFAGVEYKLCWNGRANSFEYGDYNGISTELLHYAWSKGFGNRMGIIERHNGRVNEAATGQSLGADGYLNVDENLPPIVNGSAFGDENEEFGERWIWRYGSMDGEQHRYRLAMMRSLQSRYRFITTSPSTEKVNSPLSDYAELSLGKSIETTPDAWACLFETPMTVEPGKLKNFERWLLQRDVPGGMTVSTQKTEREYDAGHSPDGEWYDYVARRTDIAGGNPNIYFNLDDRFVTAGPVDIKIEIVDENRSPWHIEYNSAGNAAESTPAFTGRGDGNIRTITFTLHDAQFSNALDHNMDFRIVADGPDNVVVRWVRVVRHQLP